MVKKQMDVLGVDVHAQGDPESLRMIEAPKRDWQEPRRAIIRWDDGHTPSVGDRLTFVHYSGATKIVKLATLPDNAGRFCVDFGYSAGGTIWASTRSKTLMGGGRLKHWRIEDSALRVLRRVGR